MDVHIIRRGIRFIRRRGIEGIFEKLHLKKQKKQVIRPYRFLLEEEEIPFQEKVYEKKKDHRIKLLNWIIPDMGEGGGGHMNIFRFISLLENRGFHSRLYLFQSSFYFDNTMVRNYLRNKFPLLDSKVEAFWDTRYADFAHATIATSWETAYYVRRFQNTISKFYFVQDYEPYFYPLGSQYQLAANTYSFGLRGIAAGSWIKKMLENKHGMFCESVGFSYDKDVYVARKRKKGKKRVFFYARPTTPRRCFEIGFLALYLLTRRMPQVEVIFAGWDLSGIEIPFCYRDLKITDVGRLAKAFSSSDLCMALSDTNLSLLPLEIMGAGSVVVSSSGDNTSWLLNKENSILVEHDPVDIADKMEYYLTHERELCRIRENGMKFARQTSWEEEAKKMGRIFLEGIQEDRERIDHRRKKKDGGFEQKTEQN
ncbi:glycosyltransferase family protein [Suipraeoptans intestinalis]|uniref:rhamnosyltransferase WsaF family glycosyltransferase n=1 Tax=Suipraeoptans intestinalis TaxID=2606628 RepID=UPI0023F11695|nr:glycosyltransferase [Suipraeoptans intestinalis]MDD7770545.1 glycosyltransferase [Suipraeoptans intestinalis]